MDIEAFSQQVKFDIGNMMLKKHRIYLDTKYWIFMRDASLGKSTPTQTRVYEKLRDLVKKEVAICPISPHIFEELMRVGDREKRLNMARVMDELSQQVCFISPLNIAGQELLSFMRYCQSKAQGKTLFNPTKCVFTKVAFVMGELYPTVECIPEEQMDAIRIQVFDRLSRVTLVEMLKTMKDDFPQRNSDLIAQLNKGKDDNQDWKSFHEIFMHEIAGILDTVKDEIEKLWIYLYENDHGGLVTPEEVRKAESVKLLSNFIYNLFDQKKVSKELPYFHINASLHAFIRYNKSQRFKKDTLIDFSHAAWALPYCNYFFTERRLCDWLCNSLLKLDKIYGAQVFCKEDDVLTHLQGTE